HWAAAFMVFLGSWLSGYFIIVTDAWMQHPVGYNLLPNGEIVLASIWGLLLNPWAGWQYAHNMIASVVTASFVMTGIGAYYLLSGKHTRHGQTFLRVGVPAASIASILLLFPTGDRQAKNIVDYQPATLAAMEGLFETVEGAPIVLIGQPNMEQLRLDNPLTVP